MTSPRSLDVPPPVLRRLLACRLAGEIARPATLDVARIERAEAELGCTLPDDLIAAWAAVGNEPEASSQWPGLSSEHTIAALDRIGELAWDELPEWRADLFPFIPVWLPEDQSDKDCALVCVHPRRAPTGETQLVSVHFYCWTPRQLVPTIASGVDLGSEPVPLSRWLMTLFAAHAHLREADALLASFDCALRC